MKGDSLSLHTRIIDSSAAQCVGTDISGIERIWRNSFNVREKYSLISSKSENLIVIVFRCERQTNSPTAHFAADMSAEVNGKFVNFSIGIGQLKFDRKR